MIGSLAIGVQHRLGAQVCGNVVRADHAVDLAITTEGHASAAMEPHAAIAQWEDDKLTVHASLQMLNYNIAELADTLGIAEDRVRIVSRTRTPGADAIRIQGLHRQILR